VRRNRWRCDVSTFTATYETVFRIPQRAFALWLSGKKPSPRRSPGTPDGSTLVLTDNSNANTTTLGTGQLDAVGHFTFTTRILAVGTHVIKAQYAGNANFNESVSLGLGETVYKRRRAR
jgi:hypothetical protein